ncbi:nuclear transport factor 2 family protein [Nocardia fusca]|uniref:nuclear transport factor 2 family protein n=1 Tax=Nocardia fusca TaxID=941183 RepID=UPI0007A73A66|nr:nuclear transport factor 2 family protein [Nocardia fusca]
MNDHEALRALKARYFRLMDTKDWSGFRALFGFGHYHETYAKIDGEWRIRTQRLTRLHTDYRPAGT